MTLTHGLSSVLIVSRLCVPCGRGKECIWRAEHKLSTLAGLVNIYYPSQARIRREGAQGAEAPPRRT